MFASCPLVITVQILSQGLYVKLVVVWKAGQFVCVLPDRVIPEVAAVQRCPLPIK